MSAVFLCISQIFFTVHCTANTSLYVCLHTLYRMWIAYRTVTINWYDIKISIYFIFKTMLQYYFYFKKFLVLIRFCRSCRCSGFMHFYYILNNMLVLLGFPVTFNHWCIELSLLFTLPYQIELLLDIRTTHLHYIL